MYSWPAGLKGNASDFADKEPGFGHLKVWKIFGNIYIIFGLLLHNQIICGKSVCERKTG